MVEAACMIPEVMMVEDAADETACYFQNPIEGKERERERACMKERKREREISVYSLR